MTEPQSCPYLGLRDDPHTAIAFPSRENHCHKTRPVSFISKDHQRQFCLSERCVECPVYAVKNAKTLPRGLKPVPGYGLRRFQLALLMVLLALLIVSISGLFIFQERPDLFVDAKPELPVIPVTGADLAATSLIEQFIPNTLPDTVAQACAQTPDQWLPYTVKLNDSLYRLSSLYGVTIKEIQDANCLGNRSILKGGDLIYLPARVATGAVP